MSNYFDEICKQNYKYYYYVILSNKIYFISKSNKLSEAKNDAINKIKLSKKKLISGKLIFIKIVDTSKEFEDKTIPLGIANGPVALKFIVGLITDKNKIISNEKIQNDKYYLSVKYIKENITNISKELKKIIIKFLNSLEKKKFISLSSSYAGNACAIKQSIINYYSNEESQFFDWLVCNMKSVNEVLSGKELLLEDKYIYPNNLGTTSINFIGFNKLISHHDIHEYNSKSVEETIEKYNRRYNRFIDLIKNTTNIYFIRYCKNQDDLEEKEINEFCEKIYGINEKLFFKLILISDCVKLTIPESLIENDNFIYIDLNKYIDDDVLNEKNDYFKKIKMYKSIYSILK
jgi:hypothetical protein